MKLKINNWTWTIKFVKESEIPKPQEGYRRLGLCENIELTIWINNEMPESLVEFAVRHELTHAYIFSYGLEQAELTQELLCDFVGTYGEQVLGDAQKIIDDWNQE